MRLQDDARRTVDPPPAVILIYTDFDPTPAHTIGPFDSADQAGEALGDYAEFFGARIENCKVVELERQFLDKNGMLPF